MNVEDKKCVMKMPGGEIVKQRNENLHRKMHKTLPCEVKQQIV